MEGPGKSWNFLLGYDAGGRHNGVGVGAVSCSVYKVNSCDKFTTICLLFLSDSDQRILEHGCSYHTMYIYVVSNFCLSLYLRVAGV